MDKIKFGRFLSDVRDKKKMSQEEVANLLSIKRQTLSRWERGDGLPDVESLYRLSEVYNISIEELLNSCYDEKYKTRDEIISKQLILLDDQQKRLTKNAKRYNWIFLAFLIIVLISIILCFFLYINNINKNIIVYSVNAEHPLLKPINGILFKSKDEMHLVISDISGLEKKISNIKLYYLDNGGKQKVLLETPYNNINIKDYWGYNEFFDFDNFDYYLDNLYIEFTIDEKVEFVRLLIKEDYTNKKIKFFKEENSINNLDESKVQTKILSQYIDIVNNIKENYHRSEDGYWINYDIYSFSLMDNVLSVYSKNDGYYFDFTTGLLFYYDNYDSNNDFESYFINLDCDTQICKFQNQKHDDFWQLVNKSFSQ